MKHQLTFYNIDYLAYVNCWAVGPEAQKTRNFRTYDSGWDKSNRPHRITPRPSLKLG